MTLSLIKFTFDFSVFRALQSGRQTHVTIMAIDQKETWRDQQEDKDKVTQMTITDKLRNLNHDTEG